MIQQILDYFRQTGRKVPELLPAVIFAQTELGEVFDAIMRSGMVGEGWLRNNERDSEIEVELADTYMMILLAASAMDVNLNRVLAAKMVRKGWKPSPLLLDAWREAFGGEGEPQWDALPDPGSEFRCMLWDYCLGKLNDHDGVHPGKNDISDDLRRQRAELDILIDALEQVGG